MICLVTDFDLFAGVVLVELGLKQKDVRLENEMTTDRATRGML